MSDGTYYYWSINYLSNIIPVFIIYYSSIYLYLSIIILKGG